MQWKTISKKNMECIQIRLIPKKNHIKETTLKTI